MNTPSKAGGDRPGSGKENGISALASLPAPVSCCQRFPDLQPARWIWYPSGRCLPNTFVLFRRAIELREKPKCATGWIAAESRYKLEVNGQRLQWGPPPSDPRWPEADPLARGK